MIDLRKVVVAAAILAIEAPAVAEIGDQELLRVAVTTQQEDAERETQREQSNNEAVEEKRVLREQMREAERRLAEAARRIAELSARNLPHMEERARAVFTTDRRPRLGVTISASDDGGPVEGVLVDAVTPGSAAEAAGLRAGDVLTRIEDQALSAATAPEANSLLIEFMDRVEAGDKLDVEYLRDGDVQTAEVEAKPAGPRSFVFRGPDDGDMLLHGDEHELDIEIGPDIARDLRFDFRFPWVGNVWGDLEMVELSEALGRYFGTDSGLLVISAPDSEELMLEDGDVIKSIDGREPTSVGHAMRILASYEPGEQVSLRIFRDKRQRNLELTMPDKRSSRIAPSPPPARGLLRRPAAAPGAPGEG